jgi:HWE histidine kinase/Domain of unknown function (DUF4118)
MRSLSEASLSRSGWASSDLRFAIYLPAILAAGLLAGIPASISAAIGSIVIIYWAFIPPHFTFKRPSEGDQINIILNAIPYLITVYFAYLVLGRLRRSELNNRILVKELEHRGRNLFSIMQVIIKKTLLHDPVSAETLFGRLRSIQHANELLTGKASSVSLKELLLKEVATYGADRLHTYGLTLMLNRTLPVISFFYSMNWRLTRQNTGRYAAPMDMSMWNGSKTGTGSL